MRCHRMACSANAYSLAARTSRLVVVAGLAIAAGTVWSDDKAGLSRVVEEPRALQTPITLLPITPAATDQYVQPSSAPAGPPVRLAPEIARAPEVGAPGPSEPLDAARAASFQDVTPGVTRRNELLERLGAPARVATHGDTETLTYVVGPFPHVEFSVEQEVVQSIVVHLASPGERSEVADELNLGDFRPVVLHDDAGRPLGEVYPERALMFAYQTGADAAEQSRISHVVLETVTAEPFLMRAAQEPERHYRRRLADARMARQLAPDQAAPHALLAQIDQKCGRLRSAQQAARRAVELDGEQIEYQLLLADVLRELGETGPALECLRPLLGRTDLAPLDRSRAQLVHARLLTATHPRDHKLAMQEAVASIKLAAGQVTSKQATVRQSARQLLIDGQLALAEILAAGPWPQKHEVVPQWLASAEKAAQEFIDQDEGPRDVLLSVYRTSLHCLLILEGQGTPDKLADAAIELGKELITEADDDDHLTWIEWELGTTLWHAARIASFQGHYADALKLANNADALLAESAMARAESPETAYHVGQLHFLIGSVHAVHQRDHATAVQWYDQALPRLRQPLPGTVSDVRGVLGEQLVSMGVSLWETNRKQQAVSLTEEGAEWMRKAVRDETLDKSALLVPYQNLVAMHRMLGNEEQARALASQAAEIEPNAPPPTQRR